MEDTTAWRLLVSAAVAIAAGDTFRATERTEALLGTSPASELIPEELSLNAALRAAAVGNWRGVIHRARLPAWQGVHTGFAVTPALRWLVAEAYERLERPDSAAAYFALITDPAGMHPNDAFTRAYAHTFAHRRLAGLYAQLWDDERARDHWEIFQANFTAPDPELEWLLSDSPLAPNRSGGRQLPATLFGDGERNCASIEAGRRADLLATLENLRPAQDAYFARHGRYADGVGEADLHDFGFEHLDHELIHVWIRGDERGWSARVTDLRDTRACYVAFGEPQAPIEGHRGEEPVCTERTLDDAYKENAAIVAMRDSLRRLMTGVQEPHVRRHGTFTTVLLGGDGSPWRPMESVVVDITRADAIEFRAAAIHPDTRTTCELRMYAADLPGSQIRGC